MLIDPVQTNPASSHRRRGESGQGRLALVGRTAAAAVAVATALLFGLVFTANPAAAQNPELTATAECSYGDIRVDYDAFPWSSTSGTDPWRFAIARADLPGASAFGDPPAQAVGWVTVEYTPASGGTTVLADASSPSGNREHYFQGPGDVEEGSFVVPDDPSLFPLTVHVEDHGRWKNNADAAGTTTHPNSTTTVQYPGECQDPQANPGATSSWECGDENIVVVLTNDGGGQDAFISVNGNEYVVAPDGSEEVLIPGPVEDATVQVTITVGGENLVDPVTYDGNCQNPAASVAWECGSALEVTLTNTGAHGSVPFQVNGTEYVVGPNGSQVVNLGTPAEGDAVDVTVTAPGMDDVTFSEDEVDCQNPAASVAWECGSALEVTLTNAGAHSAVAFDVNGTGYVVQPDEVKVVNLGTPAEGDLIDVTVTAPEMTTVTYTDGPVDCQNPAASVAWECGSALEVTLTNAGGELPVTFLVNGVEQVVGPDGTEVVDLGTPAEGDTIEVLVSAPGMEPVTYTEGPIDCEGVLCDAGETGVDGDGDEDADSCEPIVCDEGETPVAGDDDTNGVADTCEPIECADGEEAVMGDGDTNDVADTCEKEDPEVLPNTIVTPTDQPTQTGALAFTGASTMTLAVGALMLLLLGVGLTLAGKEFGDA